MNNFEEIEREVKKLIETAISGLTGGLQESIKYHESKVFDDDLAEHDYMVIDCTLRVHSDNGVIFSQYLLTVHWCDWHGFKMKVGADRDHVDIEPMALICELYRRTSLQT